MFSENNDLKLKLMMMRKTFSMDFSFCEKITGDYMRVTNYSLIFVCHLDCNNFISLHVWAMLHTDLTLHMNTLFP